MKKLISILVIIITSLFIAGEALSLPNCSGVWTSSWNNCFGSFVHTSGEGKGDKYVGEFKNGNFDGQGTYVFANGERYVGEFKNNRTNGIGTYVFVNGDVYVGEFKNGYFDGQGTYTYSYSGQNSGHKYVGEFKNDKRNGIGTYTFPDGERYVGQWKNDDYNGQGTFFYLDGTKDEGIWKDSVFQYAKSNYIPPNAYASGSSWKCKSGYKRVGAGCEKELIEIYKEDALPASSGSGFAITSDGYIITNYHVIEGCNNVEIIDKGQTIPATVISFDISNDLALLKSDFKPLHSFPLSRKNPYTLMEIYVAGYPFGYDISTPVKITRGIISSLAGIGNNFSRVQIDAAIQPGNSGGPIINDKGNVVGVAVSKLDLEIMMEDYGVVPEGTNFGIKSNVVINFLESNNINLIDVNTKELSKERLGKTITDGTYYISCLMTMTQIEKMRERKVMFTNLN